MKHIFFLICFTITPAYPLTEAIPEDIWYGGILIEYVDVSSSTTQNKNDWEHTLIEYRYNPETLIITKRNLVPYTSNNTEIGFNTLIHAPQDVRNYFQLAGAIIEDVPVVCNPYQDTSKLQVFGLLTQWVNFLNSGDNSGDNAQTSHTKVADFHRDRAEILIEIQAIRNNLNGACDAQ